MKNAKNTPYVKTYNKETGLVSNPITKENPFLHAPNVNILKMFNRGFRSWEIIRNSFFKGRTVVN